MFKEQIWHEEELYIDELLIKSNEPKQQIDDLREAFVIIQKAEVHNEAQPCKMILWSSVKEISRIHGHEKRHQGQSR